jgi:hypothetical protein
MRTPLLVLMSLAASFFLVTFAAFAAYDAVSGDGPMGACGT